MAIATLECTQTVYPQLENGAQIAPLGDEVRRVALCGSSGTIQDQLAFLCQYNVQSALSRDDPAGGRRVRPTNQRDKTRLCLGGAGRTKTGNLDGSP